MDSRSSFEPGGRPRLGISACLAGERVRFDAGHKRDRFLIGSLGPFVTWVSVCPEVEAGFGVPRPALRLVRDSGICLVETGSGRNRTGEMSAYLAERIERLADDRLSGFVLKKGSPSCGLERVKVYGESGIPDRTGQGLFAAALVDRFPQLPVEEEGRLCDPDLRESFVERVFAYHRLQVMFASRWAVRDLVSFHEAHKLLLLAHDPIAYGRLGRIVANPRSVDRSTLQHAYSVEFTGALARPATRRRHANVLEHMLGYFKRALDDESRVELVSIVRRFAAGLLPLAAPLALLAHHIRRCGVKYLAGQVYLNPYPEGLMLRA